NTFEGDDGNLVVDGGATATDWANVAGLVTSIDKPSGSTDNSFTQGSHEDDLGVSVEAGSIPPNKNDLTRAYLATTTVGDPSHTYLYLAWERLVNTGSANIDFELNHSATAGFDSSTLGDVTLNRTEGDLLITYDFGGSGSPTIGLLRWLTAGHGHTNADCYASGGKLPCWGDHVDMSAAGFAVAAVNTGSVTDPLDGNASLGVGLFGEAAIDLTAVPNLLPPDTCENFGSELVKSRSSGSSIDAELKDFIAPVPIHVSNCGSIELKKHWDGIAGSTTLKIGKSAGADDVDSQAVSGADGTTGANVVKPG